MRGISPISGQVVFGLREVTFLASLPNGQGNGQAATFNGFKKACEKEITVIHFCAIDPKTNKTFWAGYLNRV